MILKVILFVVAALPVVLFIRAMFFRRTTRLGSALKDFKKQIDQAITLFLVLIGLAVVFAAGKFLWAWWGAP